MKISVKVKPCAKEERIEKIAQSGFSFSDQIDQYKVWVKEKPEHGEANDAVIKVLATYFHVSTAHVTCVIGKHSGQKIFSIDI